MPQKLKEKIDFLREKAQSLSILYVEDETELRESFMGFLNKIFLHVESAENGKKALEKYREKKYDIVITDIQMPVMNGIELIRHIRDINEYQEIIVISAYTDAEFLTQSIQLSVTGYIIKPINFDQILDTLKQSAYKLNAFLENEHYKTHLEESVQERTQTILKLQLEQVDNYQHAIHSLVTMVEQRDTYTGGHSERVAQYSQAIAKAMGHSEKECTLIYEAGILHDIGKVITPDAILLKPGKLNDYEYALIKEHVISSYTILHEIPMYKELSEIVYAHHEHFDGTGYPRGLKGDAIPLFARIMSVADAFDAMTTSRIYKEKKSIESAIVELQKLSGIWYDAEVLKKAIPILKEVVLDDNLKQTPNTYVDDERFAYFYKDPLTHVYNSTYLDFILQNNHVEKNQKCLHVLYLRNFNAYNQEHGWNEGDIVLQKFSEYLKKVFPDSKIFRIFGDDFVLLHEEDIDIDLVQINNFSHFQNSTLHCDIRHIDLEKTDINSYKELQSKNL
jgi:putative nucleotidyltransferase with HDIG domain